MASQHSPAVKKSITVPLAPNRAFELFTREIDSWWPKESHSVGLEHARRVEMDARVGGTITEEEDNGASHTWGTILIWEPGRRVSFTWHPGRDPAEATTVDISFAATEGGCEVTLVHSGWEVLGETAHTTRAGYDTGWDFVFGERFARVALG